MLLIFGFAQAAAASAAKIAQLESELDKRVVVGAVSADLDGLKKQLSDAEARVKIAEQRATDAAAAAAAAGKQSKDREKAIQDAATKEMEHLKGEVVSFTAADDWGRIFNLFNFFFSLNFPPPTPSLLGSLEERRRTQRNCPPCSRTGFCCCCCCCFCCCCHDGVADAFFQQILQLKTEISVLRDKLADENKRASKADAARVVAELAAAEAQVSV